VPLERQLGQWLNAQYLEREGYGMCTLTLDDPDVLPRFLARIPACAAKLASYAQTDNSELLAAVDGFLHRAATEPR
jgi:hypothetical protein